MQLTVAPHTVFILVGPTLAGKTTWVATVRSSLRDQGWRAAHLSSDEYRRMLAGDLHRHAPRMREVSDGAFRMLDTALAAHLAHPVSTPFVFVDTTGMNEPFREQVRETAERAGYQVVLVVFDFKNRDDYFSGATTADERAIVAGAVERLKKDVLPSLKRKRYSQVVKVADRAAPVDLVIEGGDLLKRATLVLEREAQLAIVGDVHESVAPLTELQAQLPPGARTVLLGDWMDKGGDPEGMLTWIEANPDALLLLGNHERYLRTRLTGGDASDPEEHAHFTSLARLQESPALASRFLAAVDRALPFLIVTGEGRPTVYVTHAPAPAWALGKVHKRAIAEQVNQRVKERTPEGEQAFVEEMLGRGDNSLPMHVFGHWAHAGRPWQRNQVWLDTGAAMGGKLSALVLHPAGARRSASLVQVSGAPLPPVALRPLQPPVEAPLPPLTEEEERVLARIEETGARFISGTMAPAPAKDGQLEPLAAALDYFAEAGVPEVVLEPKFMGSRAQVYLTRGQPDAAFAVSRNGHRISWADGLQAAVAKEQARLEAAGAWESLVLDGELMPWAAVGASLIARDFLQHRAVAGAEVAALHNDPVFQAFKAGADYRSHDRLASLAVFDRQMQLYGQPGEVEYIPFTILEKDGVDWTGHDQAEVFSWLTDRAHLVINPSSAADRARAQAFFAQLTTDAGMEGVVVKPRKAIAGVAPYMKVRNEDYLHIIYGYDYKLRYAEMVRNKRVQSKLRLSIKEWGLGRAMLAATPEHRRILAAKLLLDIREEARLDPRL